jgi:DNA ligase-1
LKFGTLLDDLRGTSKPSEKQSVLGQYDSEMLRYLLRVSYDPFILLNVSIKPKEIPTPAHHDLGEIFDEVRALLRFCQNSKSHKQNRERVMTVLEQLDEGSQQLLVGVLNKNWKVGISAKTVLKVFPDLINRFDVQLANTYDPDKAGHQLESYIISYKLDGLRCIALRESSDEYYDKGKWTLYSRKGKEFLTVDHLKPQLEVLYEKQGWTFLDGELYKHGLAFEEIQGPVMAYTQGPVPEMEYHVFVAGSAEKFLAGKDPNHVDTPYGSVLDGTPHIHYVNMGLIAASDIEQNLEAAFDQGYEGIMLRDPNQLYDYKRSNALLKLKKKLSGEDEGEVISDCVVESIEYNDNFPYIEDGVLKTERLLNKIWVIQEDGTRCKVGSGFDLDFRRYYTEHPQELIGKIVEVKHQMWGANGRMRFPRLFRVREDL